MENREFYIDKDGFQIHAKLDFPEDAGEKMPLVIVVHGLTGHMEETHIIGVARTCNEMGFAALRVEMYGHGKTDGAFCNHNISEWINELVYIIDYARSLSFVTDIYLTGHSQGGLTVMLTAAIKADQIKAIMPLSPAVVILDSCRSGKFFGTQFDPDHIPDELHFWDDKYVTSNYIRMGRTLHIEEAIEGYSGPVLLVHGTEDEAVPVSYSIDAAPKYKNAQLVLIPEDDHCYNSHLDQVEDAIRAFLAQQR